MSAILSKLIKDLRNEVKEQIEMSGFYLKRYKDIEMKIVELRQQIMELEEVEEKL